MKNIITKLSLVVSVISLLVVGFFAVQLHDQKNQLREVKQEVVNRSNVVDPRERAWALQNIWVFDNQAQKYILTHISKDESKVLRNKLLKNQSGLIAQKSITDAVVPFIYIKNNKISYDKLTSKGTGALQLQRVQTDLTYK